MILLLELILENECSTFKRPKRDYPKCTKLESDAVISNILHSYPGIYLPFPVKTTGPIMRPPCLLNGDTSEIPLAIREALNVVRKYQMQEFSYSPGLEVKSSSSMGNDDKEGLHVPNSRECLKPQPKNSKRIKEIMV